MAGYLVCGHPFYKERPRPHVGDAVCQVCGRQDAVYDWDLYNSLGHIPEPGKRGSLMPAAQRGPESPVH